MKKKKNITRFRLKFPLRRQTISNARCLIFRMQSYNKKKNKGRRFVFRTESPFNFIEISIFVTRFFEFEF